MVKTILSDILDKAKRNGLISKNPAKNLITQIDNEYPKERRALRIQETELFLEYGKESRYYNLFVVALETGMRIGELKALYWNDIDFSRRALWVKKTMCLVRGDHGTYFEVHNPKTFSGNRLIPLTNKCIEALMRQKALNTSTVQKYKDTNFTNLVFPSKKNQPFHDMVILESIHNVIAKMAADGFYVEKFGPHTFRHTFATRCFEHGIDAKVVQSYLGHASVKMTLDLYTHVTKEKSFNDIEKLVDNTPNNIVDFKQKIS